MTICCLPPCQRTYEVTKHMEQIYYEACMSEINEMFTAFVSESCMINVTDFLIKQSLYFHLWSYLMQSLSHSISDCDWKTVKRRRHYKLLSNYQLNAQFLYSITIYMLHYNPWHVSSSTMLIFRRKNCIITASGIVTLCKQLYSMQVESGLFLKMSIVLLETFQVL